MTASDVIILTGPPGSGKSTTARSLAAFYPRAVHMHTDDFWHFIVAGGIPPYLPESDAQNQTVMQVIRNAASTYAAGGFTTVVDGVIGPWMLDYFRNTKQSMPVSRLHYVVLRPSCAETLRRAQARTTPDALVDEKPIVSLWEQFSNLESFENHVIDTTTQSSSETLEVVQKAIANNCFVLA